MGQKPEKRRSETERHDPRHGRRESPRPWENTRPRGNGLREDAELSKSYEKLTAVLGH
jgi:hypothetical protein